MVWKTRSVQPATFALVLSALGPSWAARLEAQGEADCSTVPGGMFSRVSPYRAAGQGFFATAFCLLGLSL
jgi:hypothetical protein